MPDRVADFVERALAMLAEANPAAALTLATQAPAPMAVHPRGGSAFGIAPKADTLAVVPPAVRPRVLIELEPRAIDGLLFGQSSLLDAIARGDLDVYGASADIAALDEFIRGCLEIAARSSRLEALALEWRRTR